MSPSSPSFSPPLNLSPQSPGATSPLPTTFLRRAKPRGTPIRAVSPLSTAFTPNRSLTPLSTAFTQTHRGMGVCLRSFSPLVTRHSPLATRHFPRPLFSYSYELLFPPVRRTLGGQPLILITIRIAPGVTLRSLSDPGFSMRLWEIPFFQSLRTLDLCCHSFSVSRPLFSTPCALFSKNTRGVGIPGRFCSATSASNGSLSHSSDKPNRPEEICMRTRNIMIRTILVSLELPAHVRH